MTRRKQITEITDLEERYQKAYLRLFESEIKAQRTILFELPDSLGLKWNDEGHLVKKHWWKR